MISAHCVKQYWLLSPFQLFANLHWHSSVSAGKREGKCDWHINQLQVNISHIDVISCILSLVLEEKEVLYCFVPSRKNLRGAGGTRRPTSVVLIQSKELYEDSC